jgi:phosphoglycolate phosphatase-like HAD superfamily hydrolase
MKYKHLIFDFDGVLAETNEMRFTGFTQLFQDYPQDKLDCFINYVRQNGGLSRYEKIRYFFAGILGEPLATPAIKEWATKYSRIVKQSIIEAKPVPGSLEFLENFGKLFDLTIVSGSDQEELRAVCQARGMAHYFAEILGSPPEKEINLNRLLTSRGWEKGACIYIGDSINDYEAACNLGIDFVGRDSGLIDWQSIEGVAVIKDLWELSSLIHRSS